MCWIKRCWEEVPRWAQHTQRTLLCSWARRVFLSFTAESFRADQPGPSGDGKAEMMWCNLTNDLVDWQTPEIRAPCSSCLSHVSSCQDSSCPAHSFRMAVAAHDEGSTLPQQLHCDVSKFMNSSQTTWHLIGELVTSVVNSSILSKRIA